MENIGNIEKLYLPVSGETRQFQITDFYALGVMPDRATDSALELIKLCRRHHESLHHAPINLKKFSERYDNEEFVQSMIKRHEIPVAKVDYACIVALSVVSDHVRKVLSWLAYGTDVGKIQKEGPVLRGTQNRIIRFGNKEYRNALAMATLLLASEKRELYGDDRDDEFYMNNVPSAFIQAQRAMKHLDTMKELTAVAKRVKGVNIAIEIRDENGGVKQRVTRGHVEPVIYGHLSGTVPRVGCHLFPQSALQPKLGFIVHQEGVEPQLSPSHAVPSLHLVMSTYKEHQ